MNQQQLDSLQMLTTPLNIPKFKETRDKYELNQNQMKIFQYNLKGQKHSINKEIKEALKDLAQKQNKLENELQTLAKKSNNIHHRLSMPTTFGLMDNPSQEGHMTDYDSVPKFIPNSPKFDNFELTWHNLVRAAGNRLSEEGFKQVLGCKLFGDAAEYFNLYKEKPLDQLITILTNRFGSHKPTELYLQEIEDFKRTTGQSLTQTLEHLKFLVIKAYQNKSYEEQASMMNSIIRRTMPRLVSREVLKKIYEEEKRHDNTGIFFDFEHSALTNDALEGKLPKNDLAITAGLHQLTAEHQGIKQTVKSNPSKAKNLKKQNYKQENITSQKEDYIVPEEPAGMKKNIYQNIQHNQLNTNPHQEELTDPSNFKHIHQYYNQVDEQYDDICNQDEDMYQFQEEPYYDADIASQDYNYESLQEEYCPQEFHQNLNICQQDTNFDYG